MPEITCDLTDAQYALLRDGAARAGMTIEEYTHAVVEAAVADRFKTKEVRGNVVSLEALKSRLRGPPGMP